MHAAAVKRQSTIGYHLKIDTGMNRLGFRHDNLRRTLPEVLASDHLVLEGVFTHFASADEPESPVFNTQRERFDAAYEEALAQARESLDLTELFKRLEHWRRVALLQSNPEDYRRVVRRAAEALSGQPVPEDEPLEVSRTRAGL